MMLPFYVMSWNLGSDTDFLKIETVQKMHLIEDGFLAKAPKFDNQESMNRHLDIVNRYRIGRINQLFKSFAKDIPILCLQECVDESLNQLPDHFKFYQGDNSQDTAVAWNQKYFDLIKLIEVDLKKERTIVLLREKTSEKIIAVCSAHLTGFFDADDHQDTFTGNKQLEEIGAELENLHADLTVVGMDANATPAYQKRLDILGRIGYQLDDFEQPTHFSVFRAQMNENPLQKLDYIAVKGSQGKWFKKDLVPKLCFVDKDFFTNERHALLGDPKTNPSDHSPLILKLAT